LAGFYIRTFSGSWSPVGQTTSYYNKVTASAAAYNEVKSDGISNHFAKVSDSNSSGQAAAIWTKRWHYFCNTPTPVIFHSKAQVNAKTSEAWNIHNYQMMPSSVSATRTLYATTGGGVVIINSGIDANDGSQLSASIGSAGWQGFGLSYAWDTALDKDGSWDSGLIPLLGSDIPTAGAGDVSKEYDIGCNASIGYTGEAIGPQRVYCEVSLQDFLFWHD
jgi:hypothetical protein